MLALVPSITFQANGAGAPDSVGTRLDWLPDSLPFLVTALGVPLLMLVVDLLLRKFSESADSAGSEFYLGNAAINFAAIPAIKYFQLQGFEEEKLLAALIGLGIINVVAAILAMMVQKLIDKRALWFWAKSKNLRGLSPVSPKLPRFRRWVLWFGVYFLVAVNILLFLYILPV